MQLFFHPDLSESFITLTPEESRHVSVLRLKPGENLYVTDGKGLLCKAMISDSNSRALQLHILERHENHQKPGYYLHLAIAPTKQMERLEWFLEKATEIGISEISLIYCRHAERKEVKTDRLQKILQSAIKQSLKTFMPVLNEPVLFDQFIKSDFAGQKLIASGSAGIKDHLQYFVKKNDPCLVIIGPEGDFTKDEIEMAILNNCKPVSLGQYRLRTETAGVVVCADIAMINH